MQVFKCLLKQSTKTAMSGNKTFCSSAQSRLHVFLTVKTRYIDTKSEPVKLFRSDLHIMGYSVSRSRPTQVIKPIIFTLTKLRIYSCVAALVPFTQNAVDVVVEINLTSLPCARLCDNTYVHVILWTL